LARIVLFLIFQPPFPPRFFSFSSLIVAMPSSATVATRSATCVFLLSLCLALGSDTAHAAVGAAAVGGRRLADDVCRQKGFIADSTGGVACSACDVLDASFRREVTYDPIEDVVQPGDNEGVRSMKNARRVPRKTKSDAAKTLVRECRHCCVEDGGAATRSSSTGGDYDTDTGSAAPRGDEKFTSAILEVDEALAKNPGSSIHKFLKQYGDLWAEPQLTIRYVSGAAPRLLLQPVVSARAAAAAAAAAAAVADEATMESEEGGTDTDAAAPLPATSAKPRLMHIGSWEPQLIREYLRTHLVA
jgi:hypothetical protein